MKKQIYEKRIFKQFLLNIQLLLKYIQPYLKPAAHSSRRIFLLLGINRMDWFQGIP